MKVLKAYMAPTPDGTGLADYYLKYEADKVIADLEESHKMEVEQLLIEIAEKDKEIARLKAIRKVHVEAIESMGAGLQQDEQEIRHQKYKRCMAMVRWCRIHDEFTQLESERLGLSQRALFIEYRRKAMWWNKWHRRWLELAEKFKPNNKE